MNCAFCKKQFESNSGYYKHNKTYHPELLDKIKKTEQTKCDFCYKELSSYGCKWRHEKTCKHNGQTNVVIKNMKQEIDNLKSIINKSSDDNINNKINYLTKEIKEIKNKPNIININKYEQKLESKNDFFNAKKLKINNNQIQIWENNFVNVLEICYLFNKSFNDWEKLETSKSIIEQISKQTEILLDNLIIKKTNEIILVHPLVALQVFQWISPVYGSEFAIWFMEQTVKNKENIINIKNEEIKELVNNFVKKKVRTKYPDANVLYLLTTEFHKKNNIYIVGKAKDLASRLSTYNKTCEHEVVYYASCENEEVLKVAENMVLTKLDSYREVANRDRFILPVGKPISFFTDVIDEAIEFLKTTKEKKPMGKAEAISQIQQLLDKIKSQAYIF